MKIPFASTAAALTPVTRLNIIMAAILAFLVLQVTSQYLGYRHRTQAIATQTAESIDSLTTETAIEVAQLVSDPLFIAELDHTLAKRFNRLATESHIFTTVIAPPPAGIPEDLRSELHNTHLRVKYWTGRPGYASRLPARVFEMFQERMSLLESHTHERFDEHPLFGHDHVGDTPPDSSQHDTQPLDQLPPGEYETRVSELDGHDWLVEDVSTLDRTFRIDTIDGSRSINVKDFTRVYRRVTDLRLDHYLTMTRSGEGARYCDQCHGYEQGRPLLIHLYGDLDESTAAASQDLRGRLTTDLIWFGCLLFIGFTGAFYVKRGLRDSHRLTSVIEATPDIVALAGADGTVAYLNQSARTTFGLAAGENPKTLTLQSLHGTAAGSTFTDVALPAALRDGAWSGQSWARRTNAGDVPVSEVLIAGRGDSPEPNFMAVIMRDQTQQRLLEMHLRRFRALIDLASEEIYIVSADGGTVIEANAAASNHLGYSPQELLGITLADIAPRLDLHSGAEWQRFVGALRESAPHLSLTTTVQRKDGAGYPSEMTISLHEYDQRAYLLVVARDITARLAGENALRRAQKLEAIGTMAGGIAHDFNNILAIIMGSAMLMEATLPEEGKSRHYLRMISNSGERARTLVKQILTFSRVDTTESILVDLAKEVPEALIMVRSVVPAQFRIVQHISDVPCLIRADVTQVHQVLVNLCANAYQAMPSTGGTITVRVQHLSHYPPSFGRGDGPAVLLEVSDTGCGIAEQDLGSIFDPFYTTKDPGKGTGLGLSVVHGIVTGHKGDIAVESTVGTGTTFRIFFQSVEGSGQQPAAARPAGAVEAGTGRILVVEDEEELAAVYASFLESLGYQVALCHDGREALARVSADPHGIDLVVTDLSMPEMTGVELARKIAELRADLFIVLTTGYADGISVEDAHAVGISHVLMKPVNLNDLGQVVRARLAQQNLPG